MSPKLVLPILCLLLLLGSLFVDSVEGSSIWSKTFGGTEDDTAYSVVATSDGGYVMAGYTASFGAGSGDLWLVKTNARGDMVWNRTYGGSNQDSGLSLQQTEDGGYIVVGHTGWTEELPYDKNDPLYIDPARRPREFHFDAYLVKTDENGNLLWNRNYSCKGDDRGFSVKQTFDGGYIIAGDTRAFDSANVDYGDYDVWLIKTDVDGDVEWNRTYGGEKSDRGRSVLQTSDGGYVIAGESGSDFWLIKTDSNGFMTWNKTYCGNDGDHGMSVIQTSEGGLALAGYTSSFGAGLTDGWLVKIDEFGNMEWNQTYGGSENDIFWSVQQTDDGGYILAGSTGSFGVGVSGICGGWLVKTDGDGNLLWNRIYGGEVADYARSLVATSDGGYVFAGLASSVSTGDTDFWLVKTDTQGVIPEFPSWTILPLIMLATAVVSVYKKKLTKN